MLRLTTLRIGECSAPAWAAGRAGGGRCVFPALATLIEAGDVTVLVDTGYGPAFLAATDAFPARFYRWLTPVRLPPEQHLTRLLPCRPDLVVLTHMHGDHVGGLPELPEGIEVLASAEAIGHLRGLGNLAAVRAACPPLLRDAVLARDPQPVERGRAVETGLEEFPLGHDLLGDGRMIALPLPGHGVGQIGLWLPGAARLLVADAAYGRDVLRAGRMPPGPVLRQLGEARAYRQTFAALCRLMTRRPDIRIDPSHCAEVEA
jgi:glyoxylase-like metal-dependent hydrolase (beta-lactamase superfamily II)